MSFPAFARTVANLLENMGYEQVTLMKAMHGRGKGRNAHGGYDLQMRLPTRLTHGVVIAQIKQYREPVPRAYVDELRGAMLRVGATQGLLISSSTFSASAVEAAQAGQHAAPVRLLGGEELARLLQSYPASETFPSPAAPSPASPAPSASTTAARAAQKQEADRKEREFLDSLSASAEEQGRPPAPPSRIGNAAPENANRPVVLFTVEVALIVPDNAGSGRKRP